MAYMALYRKWRPNTFEEVKGQDHIVTTLRNQIKNNRIGHAYLFCGTRGTGKTSVAKLFAKAVNCEHPVDGSPCGECALCKSIANGTSMNVIEIDAASNNGVDNIRQIREEVQYSPSQGRYLVYIIDEVHMLSPGAFNALLKTLEEPPSYVIFILATTESHKIPVTISSRCQKYDFRRISVEVISDRLRNLMEREQIEAEEKALEYVAKAADGSMRDALSILDQCIAFNLGQKLTYDKVLETVGAVDIDIFVKLLTKVMDMDVSGAIDVVDQVVWQGRELGRFVSEFTWFMRNVLLLKLSPDNTDVLDMTAENIELIRALAERIDADTLLRYINIFSAASADIKYAVQKRIVLELAVIKLCKPEMETDYSAVLDRIRILEQRVSQGVGAGDINSDIMSKLQEMMAGMKIPGAGTTIGAENNASGTEDFNLKDSLHEKLPEADYNELMEFVEQWDFIISGYQKITRGFLEGACINLAEDGRGLLLTYVDNRDNAGAIKYFSDKTRMAILKSKIEEATGRKVNIALRVLSQSAADEAEIKKNDLTKINFNIIYK